MKYFILSPSSVCLQVLDAFCDYDVRMKKILLNINTLNGFINSINLYYLFIGTVIFGILLSLMLNMSENLKVIIKYKDHDPMCLGMDGWKIPLEDCYWTSEN